MKDEHSLEKEQHEGEPRKILPDFAVRDEETPEEERDRHETVPHAKRQAQAEEEELSEDGFPANEPSREGKFSA